MIDKSKARSCYYLANIVLTIKVMLASSSLVALDFGDTLLAGVYLFLILIKLASQEYHIKDLLIFGIIGLLAVYTCRVNDNYYLMFSCLGCFAIQDIDLRTLLRYRCWTKAAILLFHVLYTVCVMAVDFEAVPTIERGGHVRYYFYLGQPNTFQMYLLWTTLELLYVYFDAIGDKQLLAALAINVFFYLFTNSNTGIQVLLVTIGLTYLVKHDHAIGYKVTRAITQYGYGAIAVLMLAVITLYHEAGGVVAMAIRALDHLMTGRLAYGSYALFHDGLTLIGHKLNFSGKVLWEGQWFDTLYLDSAYMAILLKYGIIWLLIFGYGIYHSAKKNDTVSNLFWAAYILYGVMESYALDASVCFPILFLGAMYYEKDRVCADFYTEEMKNEN